MNRRSSLLFVAVTLGLACAQAALAQKKTGTFIDRKRSADLRVVSYNVNWDRVFPDVDATGAEKFKRVVRALNPDALCLHEISKKSAADVAALMNKVVRLRGGGKWYAFRGWTNVVVSRYRLKMTGDRTVPAGQRELAYALVDLPNSRYRFDLFVLNNHFKCCGGTDNDPQRQQQADAIVNWIRDGRTPGGAFDLPKRTSVIIAGDLNIVGGPQPLATVVTGDISDEITYGVDFPPDSDDTALTDAQPLHNAVGPETYTWRDDRSRYPPGRLDYVVYSDSLLEAVHSFVLNTTTLDDDALKKVELEKCAVTLDVVGQHFDQLPVVVDFRVARRR